MDNNFLQDIFKMYLEESGGMVGEFKCQTMQDLDAYKRVTIKSGDRILTIDPNLKDNDVCIYIETEEGFSYNPRVSKERIRAYIRELYY